MQFISANLRRAGLLYVCAVPSLCLCSSWAAILILAAGVAWQPLLSLLLVLDPGCQSRFQSDDGQSFGVHRSTIDDSFAALIADAVNAQGATSFVIRNIVTNAARHFVKKALFWIARFLDTAVILSSYSAAR